MRTNLNGLLDFNVLITLLETNDSRLTEIVIERDEFTPEQLQALFHALGPNKHVRKLTLLNNAINSQHIVPLKGNTTLRELTIYNNKLGDGGAALLASLNLRFLAIYENDISPVGAQALAACPSLRILCLGSNQLGNAGAIAFKDNSTLQVLDLSNNKITDIGIKTLVDTNTSLVALNLGNNLLTNNILGDLKKHLLIVNIDKNYQIEEMLRADFYNDLWERKRNIIRRYVEVVHCLLMTRTEANAGHILAQFPDEIWYCIISFLGVAELGLSVRQAQGLFSFIGTHYLKLKKAYQDKRRFVVKLQNSNFWIPAVPEFNLEYRSAASNDILQSKNKPQLKLQPKPQLIAFNAPALAKARSVKGPGWRFLLLNLLVFGLLGIGCSFLILSIMPQLWSFMLVGFMFNHFGFWGLVLLGAAVGAMLGLVCASIAINYAAYKEPVLGDQLWNEDFQKRFSITFKNIEKLQADEKKQAIIKEINTLLGTVTNIDELNTLFILLEPYVNVHENPNWDDFWGYDNTSSWQEVMQRLRQKGMDMLSAEQEKVSNPKTNLERLQQAKGLLLFNRHRSNYFLSGGYGRTAAVQAIERMQASIQP